MKSKTIWYILLGLMLFGSVVMVSYHYIGMILFGLSAYTAGAYHIKWRLEKDNNEFKELIGEDSNEGNK